MLGKGCSPHFLRQSNLSGGGDIGLGERPPPGDVLGKGCSPPTKKNQEGPPKVDDTWGVLKSCRGEKCPRASTNTLYNIIVLYNLK